jgi:hypothetical protein
MVRMVSTSTPSGLHAAWDLSPHLKPLSSPFRWVQRELILDPILESASVFRGPWTVQVRDAPSEKG